MPTFHIIRKSGAIWKLNSFHMSVFVWIKDFRYNFEIPYLKAYSKLFISTLHWQHKSPSLNICNKPVKRQTLRPSYLPHHSHTLPLVSHQTLHLWSSSGCGNRQGLNSNIISWNTVPLKTSVVQRPMKTSTRSWLGSVWDRTPLTNF